MNSTNEAGVRPKSWKEFLIAAGERITTKSLKKDIGRLIRIQDYLTACELIKDSLGQAEFVDIVTEEFQAPGFRPSQIHTQIFKLDSKIVITPNFDNIYDRHAQTESSGTVIIKRYDDTDLAQVVRANKRLILKMHGSIETPNNLIFTRSDYASARTQYWSFYSLLDALAITNTFLFLGCGTSDPDIRLILEDYRYKFKFNKDHYFVMSKRQQPKSVIKVIESTLSLKVVTYDEKDGHKELLDSITNLAQLVEVKREEISQKQSW